MFQMNVFCKQVILHLLLHLLPGFVNFTSQSRRKEKECILVLPIFIERLFWQHCSLIKMLMNAGRFLCSSACFLKYINFFSFKLYIPTDICLWHYKQKDIKWFLLFDMSQKNNFIVKISSSNCIIAAELH